MSNQEYEAEKKKRNERDIKVSIVIFSLMFVSLVAGITYIVVNR